MDNRKIILSVLGLLLIVVAIFGAKAIIDSNVKKTPPVSKAVKTVLVDTVQNRVVPIVVPANGRVTAVRKLELFSEVQGIFQSSSKDFLPGQRFKKGQVLININSQEYAASVQAAKSDFYNRITSIMPDLRLDFPEAFPKWQAYLQQFDINKPVPALPEVSSEKEKYFITGRGVFSAFYQVNNLEERLSKYSIVAPFDGVLTEALVTRGTLIRQGQKLGEFIDPSVYELEVAIAKKFSDLLEPGEEVYLSNLDGEETYIGKVSRINARIDQNSQTIQVFITVSGEKIQEGMFLQAKLKAKAEENAIEIPRGLLVDRSKIFLVRDGVLHLVEVDPVFFGKNTVVIKGLEDGQQILASGISGAYPGMLVEIQEEQEL
jgi:membrane fusion protein, multidrug efflux system